MRKSKRSELKINLMQDARKERISTDTEALITYLQACIPEGQNHAVLLKDEINNYLQVNSEHILGDLIQKIQMFYNIKSDISGWSMSYFPPGQDLEIKSTDASVGIRILYQIKGSEIYTPYVSFSGQVAKNAPFFMSSGCAITIPGLVCQFLRFSCDCKKNGRIEFKNGFRSKPKTKDSANRHLLVIDGHFSEEALKTAVKEKIGVDVDKFAEKFGLS